jgi:MFS family permease
MSQIRAIWHPYVLYGLVAALGMSAAYVPCTATVARWFTRRRGLAIGVASAGQGLGTFALPPVAQLIVTRLGWRWAYVIFGIGIFFLLNLIATVMRRDPESVGLRPDGARAPEREDATARRGDTWTVGAAARTTVFWLLFAIFGSSWISLFVPLVHLVPMAGELGIPPLAASSLLSALGLAATLGRLLLGAVSDRAGRRPMLAIALAVQVIAFVALGRAHSLAGLYVAAALFGISYAGVSVMFPAMVTDIFGREHAGALVGVLFATAGSAAAWGPLAAGWIYDTWGSYTPAWWFSAGFNLFALALLACSRLRVSPHPARSLDPSRPVG